MCFFCPLPFLHVEVDVFLYFATSSLSCVGSSKHPIDNHTAIVRFFFSTFSYPCKIIKAVFKRQNGTEMKSLKQISCVTIIYTFYNCLTWNLFFPLRCFCTNSITCSNTRCIQQFRFLNRVLCWYAYKIVK